MRKKLKWVMKNSRHNSWTYQHQPMDYDDISGYEEKGPKTEKLELKTQIQAAILREVMIVGMYGEYNHDLEPNVRNFTDGQLDCILELVVKLRRKKDKDFNPLIGPDHTFNVNKLSKEHLDHLKDPLEFELTDNNKELQEILNTKSMYKRVTRDKITNLWNYQSLPVNNKPVKKNKAVTTVCRTKEQIQAAIARELDMIVIGDIVFDPALKQNIRNFTDNQVEQIVELIIKLKEESDEQFEPIVADNFIDLVTELHQNRIKKVEDYELSDNNEELQKILNPTSLPAVTKPSSPALNAEESKVVNEAVTHIKLIYVDMYQKAHLEIANYLAEKFFDNDFERIKNKKPVHSKSFNQLVERLQEEITDFPRKTWLYDCLGLFVEEDEIKKLGDDIFRTYGKFSVSLKTKLMRVPEEKKIELIKETAEENYTNNELQARIRVIRGNEAKKSYKYNTVMCSLYNRLRDDLNKIKDMPPEERALAKDIQVVEDSIRNMMTQLMELI